MASTMADLTIYTLPTTPARWDRVGIFFMTYCCVWTTLVLLGMAFCWHNRHLPIIKLRGLPLSFTAIACLHVYWILAQITYPIASTIPIVLAYDVQYWTMSLWFPLGIALFFASNCRLLHVAKLQRQQFTLDVQRTYMYKRPCTGSSWLCRLASMYYSTRIMTLIAISMVIQVALTAAMWVACKKYHPTYGIPGTEIKGADVTEQIIDLGRGWEWWPSVLWQVVWTWIVAPTLLWRAWGIRDTMGWRNQTIGCCIFSLHATPLFLLASYVPAFQRINGYFSPSQWIHLSTMAFEVFTVFVPVFQIIKLRAMTSRSAEINARWETESQQSTLRQSTSCETRKASSIGMAEKGGTLDYLDEELGDRLLTTSALDYVLGENPGPLQEFSALHDFSGENIAFLTRVANWKTDWPEKQDDTQRLEAYRRALAIYIDFVSPRDAEFSLNLSSADLKYLEDLFEASARVVNGEASVDPVTPFATDASFFAGQGSSASLSRASTTAHQYNGEVPTEFGCLVFDRAQGHIKHLVLLNSWPKFVAEMQQRRRSIETGRSIFSSSSQETLASRVSKRVTVVLNKLMGK